MVLGSNCEQRESGERDFALCVAGAHCTFNFDAKNNIFGFLAAREPQNGKIREEGSI